jgi:hypothetical protein
MNARGGQAIGHLREPVDRVQASMDCVIVRRGLSEWYYRFLRVFAVNRGLDIIVDRRAGERRQIPRSSPEDRRSRDRRGPTPPTWTKADFIVLKRDRE